MKNASVGKENGTNKKEEPFGSQYVFKKQWYQVRGGIKGLRYSAGRTTLESLC
jgi:hypothetical protein